MRITESVNEIYSSFTRGRYAPPHPKNLPTLQNVQYDILFIIACVGRNGKFNNVCPASVGAAEELDRDFRHVAVAVIVIAVLVVPLAGRDTQWPVVVGCRDSMQEMAGSHLVVVPLVAVLHNCILGTHPLSSRVEFGTVEQKKAVCMHGMHRILVAAVADWGRMGVHREMISVDFLC